MWSLDQVALHDKSSDCWVIINNNVYDVTEFLNEHPGGSKIILKYAGRDATAAYEPIHPPDALDKNLPKSRHLGALSASAAQSVANAQKNQKKTKDAIRVEQAMQQRPPLVRILSLVDMEEVARKVLSHKAESYYSSAADDHITMTENARAFSRFFFLPRVMRPVGKCDASTTILGFKVSIPVFASGAALAKLGHPLGEINISKGAAATGIIQMVSSNASASYAEIIQAVPSSQPLFFQLYKHAEDSIAEKRVREVERLGYKAIFLTVDAVVPGHREKDIKSPWVTEDLERGTPTVYVEGEGAGQADNAFGTAGALVVNDDRDMTWEKTIPWLRRITKLPLVLKGIQCVEDAVLAAEAGVDGILLSNHGGRQLEYSLPPLEVLYRLRKQRPDVFDKLEVYIDGGVQRGTDVLKALCLGATAVGLGRGFLYAQSAYGEAGVVKIVKILEREIVTAMRGLGASSISDLKPEMGHAGRTMGFCRRCGNIVTAERCKCGGMAVAPVVPWNQSNPKEKAQDRWSKTYVSKEDKPPSPTRPAPATSAPAPATSSGSSPTKRFPRPLSQTTAPQLGNRVSAHITSTTTTSQPNRPPSPLKYSSLAAAESGILPSPHDTTLSKVYGSILQPRESLPVQSCAHCATPFAPTESTIYPDPYGSTSVGPPRFFCRSCFVANGGSRGPCAACSRPVLILKSEGGFVHVGDRYWHRKCFHCAGCDKNIGHAPMVDLLGRPCCPDCFDTCLERDATPKKPRNSMSSPRLEKSLGGNTSNSKSRSREGSPALEELEQRLGIVKTREASPALEELSQRLSMIGKDSPTRSPVAPSSSRYSVSREGSPLVVRSRTKSDPDPNFSPSRLYERFKSPDLEEWSRNNSPSIRYGSTSPSRGDSESPGPTEDAIEEMKRRFMKSSSGSPAAVTSTPPLSKPRLRSSRSSGRLSSPAIPPTPDLTSDFSDTTSSAGPDSPPRQGGYVPDVDVFGATKPIAPGYGSRYTREYVGNVDDVIVEETKSQMGTPTHTPKSSVKDRAPSTKSPIPFETASSKSPRALSISSPKPTTSTTCVRCHSSLFSVDEGGRYVTVPDDATGEPRTYHTHCFTCSVCYLPFKEGAAGQALFVKGIGGPSHVECAPPQKITVRTTPTSIPVTSIFSTRAPSVPFPRPPSTGSTVAAVSESSKYDRPLRTAPPTSTPASFPRFGTSNQCPGCRVSVSPMERGVVPGPHGSRWHASCLVCGGKKPPSGKSWVLREERKKGVPGCGKKLDSAAKEDGEGGVWCRECSLLLPTAMRGSPQGSPTRAATLVPSYTGNQKVVPQSTGTTTIARQFTGYGGDSGIFRQMTGGGASPTRSVSPTKGMMGYGGADPAIFRQLTGGGLSPTRSISPTKGLASALRPRPKSVVGIRNTNIVRQMTGGGG
ncbi:FMN-dependent dehydrogenase-domain-containing protein [Favolaschia claudopus]|uniref:L-lactate dehydrogenase (cytochrome) n=1 Tax=Favolaschia claudopus TaxID=2862362 RepID=A0AAW0EHX6_9AGAR